MEFWGVEVKSGETLVVEPGKEMVLHLSQACLGEAKKEKGNLSVCLYLHADDQKFVLGTLSAEKFPQICYDLVFDKKFVLSHNWKYGSVYFSGYKAPSPAGNSDYSDSDINLGEPLPQIVKPETQAKEDKPSTSKTNVLKPDSAPKSRLVKPDSDSSEESGDDSSDRSSESAFDDDEDLHDVEVETDGKNKDDEDDESDEEDEETPKKAAPSKKRRAADSGTKTPLPDKKAKLVSPQKTDGKKGVVHVATPHPSKQAGKTAKNEKSKQQSPKSAGGFKCNSCDRSFNSDVGLQSHTKAKHSAAK